MSRLLVILLAIIAMTGCGYHVSGSVINPGTGTPAPAGKAEAPAKIHTIAVTTFLNRTTRYKLAQRLPADISREFIERTRYKIVTDAKTADLVLSGTVQTFNSYPIIADQVSGRATIVQCETLLNITLTERGTGKVLFTRSWPPYRERYEISFDPQTYFDESGAGINRLSQDVARDVVTSILENF